MIGNSLKYTTTNSNTLNSNTLWKYYQNKNNNKTTSTPSHLILSPTDNDKILNFMKFSDLGIDHLKDSSTFKKIQYFSKSNPQKLYSNLDEFSLKYKKISDLYLSDHDHLSTSNYAIKRQHNYTSKKSLLNNSSTLLDSKSVNTMLSYNYNLSSNLNQDHSLNGFKFHNRKNSLLSSATAPTINNKLNQLGNSKNNLDILHYLSFLDKNSLLSSENDSAQVNNPLKYALNNK
jgi:collagenase-like PrtC family protease